LIGLSGFLLIDGGLPLSGFSKKLMRSHKPEAHGLWQPAKYRNEEWGNTKILESKRRTRAGFVLFNPNCDLLARMGS